MVFRIQGEFCRGPGVDQQDVLGVTPDRAGDLTAEEWRHRTRPLPLMRRKPHRWFDPGWKSLPSGPPYRDPETIRAEAPTRARPGNRECLPFLPRLAVDACCSSSFLRRPPAPELSVAGPAPLAAGREWDRRWCRSGGLSFRHFFAQWFQTIHRGGPV